MSSPLVQFSVQSAATAVLYAIVALAYLGVVLLLSGRSRWGSAGVRAAVLAAAVPIMLFALAFPVAVSYAQVYVRPSLGTLDDVVTFQRTGRLALGLGVATLGAASALAAAWRAARPQGGRARSAIWGGAVALAFFLVTYPFWNLIYACGAGDGILFDMQC